MGPFDINTISKNLLPKILKNVAKRLTWNYDNKKLFLKQYITVQIQEGTKLFAIVEEWKIHKVKYYIQ